MKNFEQISISSDDEIEDDFIIVEKSDHQEDTDFERFPWLDSNHPLYFPATQASNPSSVTRWEAVDKFSVENWYPHLKKYTFESCFVALSHEDIQFLVGNGLSEYNSINLERVFDTENSPQN